MVIYVENRTQYLLVSLLVCIIGVNGICYIASINMNKFSEPEQINTSNFTGRLYAQCPYNTSMEYVNGKCIDISEIDEKLITTGINNSLQLAAIKMEPLREITIHMNPDDLYSPISFLNHTSKEVLYCLFYNESDVWFEENLSICIYNNYETVEESNNTVINIDSESSSFVHNIKQDGDCIVHANIKAT